MEDLALEWITHCDTAQPDPTTYPQFRGTTMNIMAVDGTQPVMINAARKWDSEKSNYSFYVDNCRGIFHHYKKRLQSLPQALHTRSKLRPMPPRI
ncbi:unnamed protein product [Mesocestoides corti]|uniref:SCP domain-containing protein n=1 Tax=Mesocestoides corti TaxID=53468 RepID=A0A0R3UGV7_MESCO|nr:unnamed protein product [Mesocestoides corti]